MGGTSEEDKEGSVSAKQEVREAARTAFLDPGYQQVAETGAVIGADAVLAHARVLRDHVPDFDPGECGAHGAEWVRWPCPEWTQASEALDD